MMEGRLDKGRAFPNQRGFAFHLKWVEILETFIFSDTVDLNLFFLSNVLPFSGYLFVQEISVLNLAIEDRTPKL